MSKILRISTIASTIGMLISQQCYAIQPLNIVPIGTLPTTVAAGSTVSASYLVTNMTGKNLPNNFIQLPAGAVAIAGYEFQASLKAPNICALTPGANFAIAAGQSCTIPLIISGSVQAGGQGKNLYVVTTDNSQNPPIPYYSGATVPLSVTELNFFTAAGYSISSDFHISDALPLLASSNNATTWTLNSIPDFTHSGLLHATSCLGNGETAYCVAAGEDTSASGHPLLFVSSNGGTTWTTAFQQSLLNGFNDGALLASSCALFDFSGVFCSLAGYEYYYDHPLLIANNGGGSTWTKQTLTGAPTDGYLNSTSCTGSGSSTICTAAGQDQDVGPPCPLLVMTQDAGSSWTAPISGSGLNLGGGSFKSTSCTGSSTNTRCTGAGYLYAPTILDGPYLPILATYNGTSWSAQTVTDAPEFGLYNSTSCTGSGPTAICTAVGTNDDDDSNYPLIAVSQNGNATWSVVTVPNAPAYGYLASVSCTGSGSTALCAAVGFISNVALAPYSATPLLIVSQDGGSSWSLKNIANLESGTLYTVSCTGSGSSAKCVAAGTLNDCLPGVSVCLRDAPFTPIIVSSTDGGSNWSRVTLANIPAIGAFLGTSAAPESSSFDFNFFGPLKLTEKTWGMKNLLKKVVS